MRRARAPFTIRGAAGHIAARAVWTARGALTLPIIRRYISRAVQDKIYSVVYQQEYW